MASEPAPPSAAPTPPAPPEEHGPPEEHALAAVRAALESAGVTADPTELVALLPAHERMRARVAVIEAALEADDAAAASEPAGTFRPGAGASA